MSGSPLIELLPGWPDETQESEWTCTAAGIRGQDGDTGSVLKLGSVVHWALCVLYPHTTVCGEYWALLWMEIARPGGQGAVREGLWRAGTEPRCVCVCGTTALLVPITACHTQRPLRSVCDLEAQSGHRLGWYGPHLMRLNIRNKHGLILGKKQNTT